MSRLGLPASNARASTSRRARPRRIGDMLGPCPRCMARASFFCGRNHEAASDRSISTPVGNCEIVDKLWAGVSGRVPATRSQARRTRAVFGLVGIACLATRGAWAQSADPLVGCALFQGQPAVDACDEAMRSPRRRDPGRLAVQLRDRVATTRLTVPHRPCDSRRLPTLSMVPEVFGHS
jgi:hypothetical protein